VDDAKVFGKRLREVRIWRELTLREAAGLAGRSFSFWGQVERGERAVTNRNTLEAMAGALRVHPTELTGQPYPRADSTTSEAHAVVTAVEGALNDYELGERSADIRPRPWEAIAADLDGLTRDLWPRADYAAQGAVLPSLLAELHATYVADPAHRREVLVALMSVYHCAASLTKNLGVRGLPMLATVRAARVADELDDPAWSGVVAFMRGASSGAVHRPQQYRQSVAAADALRPHLDDRRSIEIYGMLHLNAALACAAQHRADDTVTHLDEAAALADGLDDEVGAFANLRFGRTIVGMWRVSVATELGDGGRVAELARDVHPEVIPASRQSVYWADLGRGLVTERRTRDQGVQALIYAEQLAPQRIRNNVFVRETVADLLRQARRDAGGRELRGLAWRMGVAPRG